MLNAYPVSGRRASFPLRGVGLWAAFSLHTRRVEAAGARNTVVTALYLPSRLRPVYVQLLAPPAGNGTAVPKAYLRASYSDGAAPPTALPLLALAAVAVLLPALAVRQLRARRRPPQRRSRAMPMPSIALQ